MCEQIQMEMAGVVLTADGEGLHLQAPCYVARQERVAQCMGSLEIGMQRFPQAILAAQLLAGTFRPQPVKRVEIPKADGKVRCLGIPTVVDRFIQQAIAQVLSAQWEPHFHPHSYGFRPQRSAHQALRHVQTSIRDGYGWVVDIDLEAFFDRVNHDRLMARLKQRCPDAALLRLINRFLKAGVQRGERVEATPLGVPQGLALAGVGQHRIG